MEGMRPWSGCGSGGDAAVEVMRPWRGCGRGVDAAVEGMRPWRGCGRGGDAAVKCKNVIFQFFSLWSKNNVMT